MVCEITKGEYDQGKQVDYFAPSVECRTEHLGANKGTVAIELLICLIEGSPPINCYQMTTDMSRAISFRCPPSVWG